MKSWSLRIAVATVILVVVGTLALLLQRAPAPSSLPSPNGYDDFVAAAQAVAGDAPNYPEWTRDQLASFVANSSNTFALIKAGLGKECRVPAFKTQEQLEFRMERLAAFKRLAQAQAARSRLAMLDGRTNDVVDICLDAVQVSQGISRGGVLIESLVGMACEAIALNQLNSVANDLDARTARSAARRLAELDAQAPTAVETMVDERAFSRSVGGVYGSIMVTADRLFGRGSLAATRKGFESKWAAKAARRRGIILQLARHAYELEKGNPPAKDTDLVPDYLPALPEFPVAGANGAARVVQ